MSRDDPTRSILRVSRRRVPVRLLLADEHIIEGALYADVERLDGTRATLLDRLQDTLEPYLPLATADMHILVRKSKIASIQLPQEEVATPRAAAAREFRVEFALSIGPPVAGRLFALVPPAQGRLLDHLNRSCEPFLALFDDGAVTLVHVEHIVAATELTESC